MKGLCVIQHEEKEDENNNKRLIVTADVINKNFAKVNEENRSEVSGEILSHLRNFCEVNVNNIILRREHFIKMFHPQSYIYDVNVSQTYFQK